MRALLCLSMVVSASHVAVRAQAPSTQALDPEMDFSGVYVGVRAFQKPDVYPFTAEGERALSAHDPLVGDPSRYDRVLEDMPRVLLWGVTVMQIAHEAGRIEMSVERGDTVRSIHMDGRYLRCTASLGANPALRRWRRRPSAPLGRHATLRESAHGRRRRGSS